jgi:ArsR family transcriptional regulator
VVNEKYDNAAIFKALGDGTRLRIFAMLSESELCACHILEEFHITQPTLSYHMKVLTDCGLVRGVRDGAWMKYTLNPAALCSVRKLFELCEDQSAGPQARSKERLS